MRKIFIYCLILFSLFAILKGLSQGNHELVQSPAHRQNHLKQDPNKVNRRLRNQTLPEEQPQDDEQSTDQGQESTENHHLPRKHLKQDPNKVNRRLRNQTLPEEQPQGDGFSTDQEQKSTENQHLESSVGKFNAAIGVLKDVWDGVISIKSIVDRYDQIQCDDTGYLRSNYITVGVAEKAQHSLKNFQFYFDSGKNWDAINQENYYVNKNETKTYTFVKKSGGATGVCGIVTFDIEGTNQRLVIAFENPWSSWDFGAVCVFDKSETPSRLKDIYNKIYYAADDIIDDNRNKRLFNDKDCYYGSNYWLELGNLQAYPQQAVTLNGVSLKFYYKYGQPVSSTRTCVQQNIIVGLV